MPSDAQPSHTLMRTLAAGPLVLLAATAWYLYAHWAQIPPQFAVHWDLAGHPNGWSTRSFFGVYGALLTGLGVYVLLALVGWSTLHFAPHDDSHERQMQHSCSWCLLTISYVIAVAFSGAAMIPLGPIHPNHGAVIAAVLIVPLLIIGMLIWLARKPHPGAVRAAQSSDPRSNPEFWVAGGFYKNPNDPSLLVPKRYGFGYTLNLGNPHAGVMIAITVVLVLGSLLPMLMRAGAGVH